MNNSLFRKKSIDALTSPEDVNKYMKVANPATWIIVAAIIILLVGIIVWSCVGRTQSTISGVCISDGEGSYVCVSENAVSELKIGMTAKINDKEYKITGITGQPVLAQQSLPAYAIYLGGFLTTDFVYILTIDGNLEEGTYPATIVKEDIRLIEYLWE